jgi:hypothetical protein
MQENEPLFKLLDRALHFVLEEAAPDWDVELDQLEARLKQLEAQRREQDVGQKAKLRDDEAARKRALQELQELEAKLAAAKEASAAREGAQVEDRPPGSARDDLDRELARHRDLESRLLGAQRKALRVVVRGKGKGKG